MAEFWVGFAYVATYGVVIAYAVFLGIRRRRLDGTD